MIDLSPMFCELYCTCCSERRTEPLVVEGTHEGLGSSKQHSGTRFGRVLDVLNPFHGALEGWQTSWVAISRPVRGRSTSGYKEVAVPAHAPEAKSVTAWSALQR